MRSVETLVVARAVAIVLVVANHSVFGINLHGGLNALLVISGLSLAQFGFTGRTRDAIHAMARIGLRLAVPSFLVALVWQIAVGTISLPELAFYSNWLYKSRVALFPIWYAQAFSQLLIALALLFFAMDMGARIARRPLMWVSLLYSLSVAAALTSYLLWDTAYYADKLPHLVAWNFVFGWLVWAMRGALSRLAGRLALSGALALSVAILFLGVEADNGATRALIVPLIVLPVIWTDRIILPSLLVRPIIVASRATLFIFLFHYYAFWFIWRMGRAIGLEAESQDPLLRLIAGVVGPIFLWASWTAMLRVYRRGYRLWPPDASASSASASAWRMLGRRTIAVNRRPV